MTVLLDWVVCAGCRRPVVIHRDRPGETPMSLAPDGSWHQKLCACGDCPCTTWICGWTNWYRSRPRKTNRCLPCIRGLHA